MSVYLQSIDTLEKKLISQKNKYQLSDIQRNIIKKKFFRSNILIIGAAGSIGEKFSKDILNFDIKKIYFLDKNENELTELNRVLNLGQSRIKKEYICYNVLNLDLRKFILKNKINHIINFSALKHVRSEENQYSTEYMFAVNSISFLNIKYPKSVKSIFSISTDKVNKPTSLLGVSKKLMEHTLFEIKNKNKDIFVSTVRFTNVSFSKGSILKNVYDKIISKQTIGVPNKVSRYFITHNEASSLCMKSMLKEFDGKIVLPSKKKLSKNFNIKELSLKIIKVFRLKAVYSKNKLNSRSILIKETNQLSFGQKMIEDLETENEIYFNCNDKSVIFTNLVPLKNYKKIINELKNKKKIDFYKFSKKIYSKFKLLNKNKIKISSKI